MVTNASDGASGPYGSVRDLPTFQELSQQVQAAKFLTRVIARSQRPKIVEVEREMDALAALVDEFYERLGPRNWVFHDQLSTTDVQRILNENADAPAAEAAFIGLYRDPENLIRWIRGLNRHEGLRARRAQISRAAKHYHADEHDSCVLQLIAVMDGFVNDFEPGDRRGLHTREPDEMAAWDSVVGHHMGLAHVMKTFTATIKKRRDDEVFELYRNGIVHGSITKFDNVVVATKAWNTLFAVADWADATNKSKEEKPVNPGWRDLGGTIMRQANYRRYSKEFTQSKLTQTMEGFESDEVVKRAATFLEAWEKGRWAQVAGFMPPMLRAPTTKGKHARDAKDTFGQFKLSEWSILSVERDQASAASVIASAVVDGLPRPLTFRMAYYADDDKVGIPGQELGQWKIAVWAPHTFMKEAACTVDHAAEPAHQRPPDASRSCSDQP